MISKDSVTYIFVDEEMNGQRLDNFLVRYLKGVPKSHIYRIIRSGEVRINKGRINAEYRLQVKDMIRIPPIRTATATYEGISEATASSHRLSIVYEDDGLIVIDKPAGLAVHGGSGVSFGLIELLRKQRPDSRFLELVHRLDRETSGLIMIAKKRNVLLGLHEMMRTDQIDKRYLAMVHGGLDFEKKVVTQPLLKYLLPNGERRVRIAQAGQFAQTILRKKREFSEYSLLEAQLKTGRTHQIRVHLASMALPILGDDKYGDFELNKRVAKQGLKRMFLHAYRLNLVHPLTQEPLTLEAPLSLTLQQFMDKLDERK